MALPDSYDTSIPAELAAMRTALGIVDNPGGVNGWTPLLAVVSDGSRRVLQVVDWVGGDLPKPATGRYVGADGLVVSIGDAADVRGGAGLPGGPGDPGSAGLNGWTPVMTIASDGARRVLQVSDWTGGTGSKPATGRYVGVAGLVTDIAEAVDIRGQAGTAGDPGGEGSDGWSPVLAVVTDGARRVLQVSDWAGGEGAKPAIGKYVGATGLVTPIADAVDVRGATGAGTPGTNGNDGWVPVLAIIADGERRVLQVSDWTGGGGTKPATGKYIGVSGLVTNIADAVDIRGPSAGSDTEARQSLALAHIRAAKLLGSRQLIFKGVADGFAGIDGIDAVASLSYLYDPLNKRITPSYAVGSNHIPTMTGPTTSGVTMSDGGNSGGSFAGWAAGDKNTGTQFSQNPFSANNYIRVDFGSGNDKTIASYSLHCGAVNYPTAFKLQGSANGTTWVDLDSRSGVTWPVAGYQSYQLASAATYRFFQVLLLTTSSGVVQISELTLNAPGTPNAMSLVTTALTVDTAPSSMRVGLLVELTDSLTPNTDLTAEVTRTGAAWSLGTLTGSKLGGNLWYFETGQISVAGQASGVATAARLKTANGKNPRILGGIVEGFI